MLDLHVSHSHTPSCHLNLNGANSFPLNNTQTMRSMLLEKNHFMSTGIWTNEKSHFAWILMKSRLIDSHIVCRSYVNQKMPTLMCMFGHPLWQPLYSRSSVYESHIQIFKWSYHLTTRYLSYHIPWSDYRFIYSPCLV